MVELADTLDLGSSGAIHAGSSPVTRTIIKASFVYQGKRGFSCHIGIIKAKTGENQDVDWLHFLFHERAWLSEKGEAESQCCPQLILNELCGRFFLFMGLKTSADSGIMNSINWDLWG